MRHILTWFHYYILLRDRNIYTKINPINSNDICNINSTNKTKLNILGILANYQPESHKTLY